VHLVGLDVGDVRPGRHQRAGLVDAVADRAGPAPADLGVEQLRAVGLTVLVAIATEPAAKVPWVTAQEWRRSSSEKASSLETAWLATLITVQP